MFHIQDLKKLNMKPRTAMRAGGGLIAAALFLFGLVSWFTYFYADDFYYALFFRGGFIDFWKRTAEHYMKMNGRALVHFVDEIALQFGTKLFAVLNPLMIYFFFSISAKTILPYGKGITRTYFLLIGLSFVMVLPISVARETLYWITGAMNYLLPSFLAVLAFFLQFRAVRTGKQKWAGLILCFICGATTEQGGAAACVLTFSLAASEAIFGRKERKNSICGWAYFFCVLAGYLTVILAPGTFYRAVYEGSFVSGRLAQLISALSDSLMGKNGLIPYFAVLFVLISILPLKDRSLPMFLICGSGFAAVLLLFHFGAFSADYAGGVLSCICLAYCIFSAICFLRIPVYRGVGCFLLAAVAAQVVLIGAPSTYMRTMLPSVLLLASCIAALAVHAAQLLFQKSVLINFTAGTLVFLIGMGFLIPTAIGYGRNKTVIQRNEKSIMGYSENGYAEICTDISYPYSYNMFYDDGFFLKYFYDYYRLPDDAVIYYSCKDGSDIYYGETRLTHPALKDGDKLYLPLAPVITAAGGELSWSGDVLTIRLGNKTVEGYKSKWISYDESVVPLEKRSQNRFGKIYWDAELFSEVFGIVCNENGENKIYVEMH